MRIGSTGEAYGQLRNIFGSTAGFETLVSGKRVTLLHDGEQAFPAMLEAIEAAEREILLGMYWFGEQWRRRPLLVRVLDRFFHLFRRTL